MLTYDEDDDDEAAVVVVLWIYSYLAGYVLTLTFRDGWKHTVFL